MILALTGEITVLKKHTTNVWTALEETVIATLYRSQHNFDRICEDAEVFKGRELGNDEAFRTMGLLFGNNVLSPRQMPVLKRHWLHPSHEEFKPRNIMKQDSTVKTSKYTCMNDVKTVIFVHRKVFCKL